MAEQQSNKAGSAWKKTIKTKKGYEMEIISVVIGNKRYTMWPVFQKKGDKSPDYNITEDAPRATAAPARATAAPTSNNGYKPVETNEPAGDLPF